MPITVSCAGSKRQAPSTDRPYGPRTKPVDPPEVAVALGLLRQAVSDCGWTFEALESVMHRDRGYIHRVLHGDKPLTLAFIVALPDDVEAAYERRRAEHFGLIVVTPVDEVTARQHFISGLISLMGARNK